MKPIHFKAIMKIKDGNPYVLVSEELAHKIKPHWRRPLPVQIKVNNKPDDPWRINMMPVGNGGFYLYLHGDVRKASNTKVGETIAVDVWFDDEYKNGPQHPMPRWFKEALDLNPIAQKNWDMLIPSRKKEILRYFSGLKSKEVIDRNLKRALNVLSGKPERFMARSWKDGS